MDLLSLRNELAASDGRDADRFAALLAEAKAACSLTDQVIADRFGVSRPTVGRWLSGANAPHRAFRPYILRNLSALIAPVEDFDPRTLGLPLAPDDRRFDGAS